VNSVKHTWHIFCRIAIYTEILGVVQKTNNTTCLGIQGQVSWHTE